MVHKYNYNESECIIYIAVGSPPEIIEGIQDETIVSPEDAILDCEIRPGDPKAAIHWYKDTKEIYKNKKYDVTYQEDIAELTVKGSEPSDTGTYRCEAVNKIGKVQTEAKLTIISRLLFLYILSHDIYSQLISASF